MNEHHRELFLHASGLMMQAADLFAELATPTLEECDVAVPDVSRGKTADQYDPAYVYPHSAYTDGLRDMANQSHVPISLSAVLRDAADLIDLLQGRPIGPKNPADVAHWRI